MVRQVVVENVTRSAGIGGLVRYRVDARTFDGHPRHFIFTGNIFVGPVYLRSYVDGETFDDVILEPRRFGEFATSAWVHRFLATLGVDADLERRQEAG